MRSNHLCLSGGIAVAMLLVLEACAPLPPGAKNGQAVSSNGKGDTSTAYELLPDEANRYPAEFEVIQYWLDEYREAFSENEGWNNCRFLRASEASMLGPPDDPDLEGVPEFLPKGPPPPFAFHDYGSSVMFWRVGHCAHVPTEARAEHALVVEKSMVFTIEVPKCEGTRRQNRLRAVHSAAMVHEAHGGSQTRSDMLALPSDQDGEIWNTVVSVGKGAVCAACITITAALGWAVHLQGEWNLTNIASKLAGFARPGAHASDRPHGDHDNHPHGDHDNHPHGDHDNHPHGDHDHHHHHHGPPGDDMKAPPMRWLQPYMQRNTLTQILFHLIDFAVGNPMLLFPWSISRGGGLMGSTSD